jgi:hypothetical protein
MFDASIGFTIDSLLILFFILFRYDESDFHLVAGDPDFGPEVESAAERKEQIRAVESVASHVVAQVHLNSLHLREIDVSGNFTCKIKFNRNGNKRKW